MVHTDLRNADTQAFLCLFLYFLFCELGQELPTWTSVCHGREMDEILMKYRLWFFFAGIIKKNPLLLLTSILIMTEQRAWCLRSCFFCSYFLFVLISRSLSILGCCCSLLFIWLLFVDTASFLEAFFRIESWAQMTIFSFRLSCFLSPLNHNKNERVSFCCHSMLLFVVVQIAACRPLPFPSHSCQWDWIQCHSTHLELIDVAVHWQLLLFRFNANPH